MNFKTKLWHEMSRWWLSLGKKKTLVVKKGGFCGAGHVLFLNLSAGYKCVFISYFIRLRIYDLCTFCMLVYFIKRKAMPVISVTRM